MSGGGTSEPDLRVLIVDDEPLALDSIRIVVEQEPGVRVVGTSADGAEAVERIRSLQPDLVFLDVQMPGLSGFDVLERLGMDAPPAVIFVTAYDRHALRAFELHALDYVLKPFEDDRLRDALAHARARLRSDRRGDLAARLSRMLEDRKEARRSEEGGRFARRLMVKEEERIRFVPTADIDWVEAAGNYVRLHCGEERHLIRSTLSGLLEQLDPRTFVRVHRSAIVNLDRIREVQPWFGGDYVAILRDGQQVRVSRGYRDELLRPAH